MSKCEDSFEFLLSKLREDGIDLKQPTKDELFSILVFNNRQLLNSIIHEVMNAYADPSFIHNINEVYLKTCDITTPTETNLPEVKYEYSDLVEPSTPTQNRIYNGFGVYRELLNSEPQGTSQYMVINLFLDILRKLYWISTGVKPFNVKGNTPKLETVKSEIMNRRVDFNDDEYKSLMEICIQLDKELNVKAT